MDTIECWPSVQQFFGSRIESSIALSHYITINHSQNCSFCPAVILSNTPQRVGIENINE